MLITTPNLPKSKVTNLIIGAKYTELIEPLEKLGISAIKLPNIAEVSPFLSGHADLAVSHLGDEILLAGSAGRSIKTELKELGFKTKLISGLAEKYPDDAILNACIIGEYAIHRRDISAISSHDKFIHVKQGYSKCNICVLRENVIITSDISIERACRKFGFDALLIEQGHIELTGFDTGFIGGSSFMISENKIAFTGVLDNHPSHDAIIRFLNKHNIEPIFLTNKPIYDIGSAVLLTCEN